MRLGVRIERDVVAQEGQPIREVERTEAGARVVSRELLGGVRIVYIEEALEKGVQRDRLVPCTAKDNGPLKPELKVRGRGELKRIRMHPWVVRICVPLQAAIEEVIAHRSEDL